MFFTVMIDNGIVVPHRYNVYNSESHTMSANGLYTNMSRIYNGVHAIAIKGIVKDNKGV